MIEKVNMQIINENNIVHARWTWCNRLKENARPLAHVPWTNAKGPNVKDQL